MLVCENKNCKNKEDIEKKVFRVCPKCGYVMRPQEKKKTKEAKKWQQSAESMGSST